MDRISGSREIVCGWSFPERTSPELTKSYLMNTDTLQSLSLSTSKHLPPEAVYGVVDTCDRTLFQPAVVINLHRWLFPKEILDLHDRLSGLKERWVILRVEEPYWVGNEPASTISVQYRPNTLVVVSRDENTAENNLISGIQAVLEPTSTLSSYVRISRVEGHEYAGTIVHGVLADTIDPKEYLANEMLFHALVGLARVLKEPVSFEILERALFEFERMVESPQDARSSRWIVRAGLVANPRLDLYREMNLDDIPYSETRYAVDHLDPRTLSLASAGLARALEQYGAGVGMGLRVERLAGGLLEGDRVIVSNS